MINRILIRIKVIQILYSFLLVEKHFTLEGTPTSPTKEKRFAYALYLDMLVLLVKLSESIERRSNDKPLYNTRFISRLLRDDTIKSLLKKYSPSTFQLQPSIDALSQKIKDSGIYKQYLKESGNEKGAGEENLWKDLLNIIILTDADLNALIGKRENYTLKAKERTIGMLNDTMVNFLESQDNIVEIENALRHSLDKARELYFRLLYLPVDLTDLEDRLIDDKRHKFLKSEEDINPNLHFVENQLVEDLRRNAQLENFVKKNKISWLDDEPLMMRNLLKVIKESEFYKAYMKARIFDIHSDAELWKNLFKYVILENQDFLETLEESSVFWNDDLEIMTTFVLKTFRRIEDGDPGSAILSKFKDEEDARFGDDLIRFVYRDKELIKRYVEIALEGGRWDKERIAFMDMVIIYAAVAEILNFPKIPINVTVNEYLEMAKSYSSARSSQFVHGIIGGVVAAMRRDGLIQKK